MQITGWLTCQEHKPHYKVFDVTACYISSYTIEKTAWICHFEPLTNPVKFG